MGGETLYVFFPLPRSERDGLESLRGEGKVRVDNKGALPPYNPRKRRKHKDKNQRKKQKLGFPIEDFGNDRKRGRHPGNLRAVFSLPLNASIALFVTPATSEPGSMVFKSIWIPD